jgi:hypothetical protein
MGTHRVLLFSGGGCTLLLCCCCCLQLQQQEIYFYCCFSTAAVSKGLFDELSCPSQRATNDISWRRHIWKAQLVWTMLMSRYCISCCFPYWMTLHCTLLDRGTGTTIYFCFLASKHVLIANITFCLLHPHVMVTYAVWGLILCVSSFM